MKRIALALTVLLPIVAAPLGAAPAPQLAIASLKDLPVVERAPYDSAADAKAMVRAAFARARKNHKRVLIDLGGNWCPDCVVLANLMALPEMKPFLDAHFEIVKVDVGRFDKNLEIPARFGITTRLKGVPAVIIATPRGTLVNGADLYTLSDARSLSPQAIADWLAQWTK